MNARSTARLVRWIWLSVGLAFVLFIGAAVLSALPS